METLFIFYVPLYSQNCLGRFIKSPKLQIILGITIFEKKKKELSTTLVVVL